MRETVKNGTSHIFMFMFLFIYYQIREFTYMFVFAEHVINVYFMHKLLYNEEML